MATPTGKPSKDAAPSAAAPGATADSAPAAASPAAAPSSANMVAAGSMQDQASGMIALDVESFANGYMQIMLSGIGWASGEIAKTKGVDGTDELKTFTDALSKDLPEIIQKINEAAKGTLQPASGSGGQTVEKQKTGKFF